MTSEQPNIEVHDNKPAKTKQKWSLKKKIAVIVGGFLGFVALVFVIASIATSGAAKVSNDMVKYLQAGDTKSAYQLLTKSQKESFSEEDFDPIVQTIKENMTGKPSIKSQSVNSETESGTTGNVAYDIKGSDGEMYVLSVDLIKEDDGWKVNQFIPMTPEEYDAQVKAQEE